LSDLNHIREEDLELYALGALPEAEAAAVRAHAAGCRECQQKLAEARGLIATLAFAAPQELPSAAAKEALFMRIAAEHATKPQRATARDGKNAGARWWNWILLPATAALAVFSFALWQQNRQLNKDLGQARRVVANLENERLRVKGLVNVLASPETITVKLTGPGYENPASGVVRYNLYLGVVAYKAELPQPPPDKVYQMWLVPQDGAPISAGVFVQGTPGDDVVWTAQVPPNTHPKAFAVTLEPAGGMPQPTGPKVLVGAS
jgi:anti-sigma-K factor RskA